ncbi:hypothetical protein [Streptomyces sp. NPDC048436]|uniref:hypothetical protein n=1 Tax=Streptomyces sp. NPDC048436 TaxID=3365550 RepID=UPI00371D450D
MLLDRVASVAAKKGEQKATDDQCAYVKTLQAGNEGELGGPVKLTEPHEREVWMS